MANKSHTEWPVIDGMTRFCAITHAPETLVKKIRMNGSKAFLSANRIESLTLLKDCFDALQNTTRSELPEGIATPQDWLATEKAKREAIKRQEDEKSVMPTVEVVRMAAEAGGILFGELDRMKNELPPILAGLPAPSVADRMETEIENLRRRLKLKLEEIK